MAERFGHPGLLAHDLARGQDFPLEPRRPPEPVSERLDLPDAASGQQLERALELLVARLLARRERRGRSLRALAVSARFVAGGTWRIVVTLRNASADSERILLALGPKLGELPAPAESLALEVEAFGPPAQDQGRLLDEAASVRRARLGEAVRQARQAAGPEAALKVLEVDPGSRIPERRAVLAPFPDAPRVVTRAAWAHPSRRRSRPTTAAYRCGRARRRSTRCARNGWSRTAGGPGSRCGDATSSWSSTNGRNVVVFRDLVDGGWFMQRA